VSDPVNRLAGAIESSPSPFHASATAAEALRTAGFIELDPAARWSHEAATGPAFVRRDGSLVAWTENRGRPTDGVRLIGAHTDSPGLRVRPNPDHGRLGWRQISVEVYGGALWNSWLDRDLRLAGRIAVERADGVESILVDSVHAVARIPQLAIHLDREVNSGGLRLDPQTHLTPVWGLGTPRSGDVARLLADLAEVPVGSVRSWDVGFVDAQAPARIGPDAELLASGRLDDLLCVWAGVEAIAAATAVNDAPVALLVLVDHEEVGSETATGAGGNLVLNVLERRHDALGATRADLLTALAGSVCLSADVAHAVHPNYPERHDPDHQILAGSGPAVKFNANARYATTAVGAAEFQRCAARVGVSVQHYSHRSDIPCGSTIGPLTAAGLGVETVDVGAPILSMHSARELVATADIDSLLSSFTAWMTTPLGRQA